MPGKPKSESSPMLFPTGTLKLRKPRLATGAQSFRMPKSKMPKMTVKLGNLAMAPQI